MINLTNYLSANGKYPERINNSECTQEYKDSAVILLNKVNQLLSDLGVVSVVVTSGWRPKAVNDSTVGAATHSYHEVGMAVDIGDPYHILYNKILVHPDLLKKYGLWMEHQDNTPTWCHIDMGSRTDRDLQVFRA